MKFTALYLHMYYSMKFINFSSEKEYFLNINFLLENYQTSLLKICKKKQWFYANT